MHVLQEAVPDFDFRRDYVYQDELHGLEGRPSHSSTAGGTFGVHYGPQWAFLKFSQAVTAPQVSPQTLQPRC
jgi:hypothetical protein